jgi:hypothetical protein
MRTSLIRYMGSDHFQPRTELTVDAIRRLIAD